MRWFTTKGGKAKRQQGIGVQISRQDAGATQKKIESQLAGALGADRPTNTM